MDTFFVRLADGDAFLMGFDDVEATAPIMVRANPDGGWGHTGYQSADAAGSVGYSATQAARLVARSLASDSGGSAEVVDVAAVEEVAGEDDDGDDDRETTR